jgi:hypothetical protein
VAYLRHEQEQVAAQQAMYAEVEAALSQVAELTEVRLDVPLLLFFTFLCLATLA